MPIRGLPQLLCALFLFAVAAPAAWAGDTLSQQFRSITAGQYQAGDSVRFTLSRYRDNFLMQFAGDTEVFVLYPAYASLGGRMLRYDTDAPAIQIANWGSLTVYPDNAPAGLPATRISDINTPSMAMLSQPQMLAAADDEATHLAYVSGIRVSFAADWPALANDASLRALVHDVLLVTARGLVRFAAAPGARDSFNKRITTVRFQPDSKLLIQISGKTLIVTYNARLGYMGRASSRAIAFALGKLFKLPVGN